MAFGNQIFIGQQIMTCTFMLCLCYGLLNLNNIESCVRNEEKQHNAKASAEILEGSCDDRYSYQHNQKI